MCKHWSWHSGIHHGQQPMAFKTMATTILAATYCVTTTPNLDTYSLNYSTKSP